MRQLLRPRRSLQEIADVPSGMHRGKLAEDYDGIGQYVMVSLAGASAGSAFKSRIAAGDFGGNRTFPAGTLVRVFSFRGQLETFLGNLKGCIENFNRTETPVPLNLGGASTETPDASLSSDFGPNWYIPRLSRTIENNTVYVDGDELILDVRFRSTPGGEGERMVYVQSQEPLTFPIEIESRFFHEQSPWPTPTSIGAPDFSMGVTSLGDMPIHNFAPFCNILYSRTLPVNPDIAVFRGGSGSSADAYGTSLVTISLDFSKPIIWRIRITDPESSEDGGAWGTKSKAWNEDENEPDWQATVLQPPGVATQVVPRELFFYSDDVGSAQNPVNPALTHLDYIKIIEGGCIVGSPGDTLTTPLP